MQNRKIQIEEKGKEKAKKKGKGKVSKREETSKPQNILQIRKREEREEKEKKNDDNDDEVAQAIAAVLLPHVDPNAARLRDV